MKKILIALIVLTSSMGFAQESDFENELKLPEAYYNKVTDETVVKVEFNTDPQLQFEQEEIIKKIEDRVGTEKLIIVESR